MESKPDTIPGTYVFDGARSNKGMNLNKMAFSLKDEANRAAFKDDMDGYMDRYNLTDWEKEKVKEGDYLSLVKEGGGNIYMLIKIGAVTGQGLASIGAQQRGESLQEFMQTRNAALKENT